MYFKKLKFIRTKHYLREIKYMVKVWCLYLLFRLMHIKKESKKLFYEIYKDKDEYLQICYNTIYRFKTKSYKKKIPKYLEIPYKFFQNFSCKENNIKFSNTSGLRITKIHPNTYYEGIEFYDIIFEAFMFENICFHNCTFKNCSFIKIQFKESPFCYEFPLQGFSACDFYNVYFDNCNITNNFFEMINFTNVRFIDVKMNNCFIHRCSFESVQFSGNCTLKNTSFYSTSKYFDIYFKEQPENIHIDSRCTIDKFYYYDKTNITIEEWPIYM